MKPRIVIELTDEVIDWYSDGWSEDKKLMAEAKRAINQGETFEDAVKNLEKTFEVVIIGLNVN